MTRRGVDEEAVLRFRRRVLTELQTAGQVEAELRGRIDDLAAQLKASYSQKGGDGGYFGAPAQPAVVQEQRVTAAAVNAISMAQRQAEEQIRSAEEYVRNVTEYARNQYQVTVNEGHRQGLLAAESAFQRRSEQLSESLRHLESQLEFLKAFGVAFGVQVEGSLEKAREEVHSMIGNIRSAFDALKQGAHPSAGGPVPGGGFPAAAVSGGPAHHLLS